MLPNQYKLPFLHMKSAPLFAARFRLSKKWCHSEPVRTLAWESPGISNFFG